MDIDYEKMARDNKPNHKDTNKSSKNDNKGTNKSSNNDKDTNIPLWLMMNTVSE